MPVIASGGFLHKGKRIHLGVDRVFVSSLVIVGNRAACAYPEVEDAHEKRCRSVMLFHRRRIVRFAALGLAKAVPKCEVVYYIVCRATHRRCAGRFCEAILRESRVDLIPCRASRGGGFSTEIA